MITLTTLLGLGAAGGWLWAQDPVWESTTSVLVHPVSRGTSVTGGRTQGQVSLDTEAQLVPSTSVAAGAAEWLETDLTPDQLARQVTVEVPPNTAILMITFSATTPEEARAGAHAFAEAYLHHREQTTHADLAARIRTIKSKIDELNGSLTKINERLMLTPDQSATAANLYSQRSMVTSQLNTMTSRLDELATATVSAGVIISDARLPTEPSRLVPAAVLASGAMLGLVLGTGTAAVSERLVRRVRRPADISRRVGLPVLAVLTAWMVPRGEEILTPYDGGGRTFDRLRNEVLATLDGTGQVIVVASVSRGSAASLVAANLAASLSRSGNDVILVGARVPENISVAGPLTRLLGIAPTPGLSEVLAGQVLVGEALQRTPRHPRMQAIAVGGTATATGLLQSPALRDVLATLTRQAAYVVVEAPPTSASADAQSLASYADTALLVVEPRRARLADVADAAEQLRRVGTPVLGAVVVPPRRHDPEARVRADRPAPDGENVDPRPPAGASLPARLARVRPSRARPYPPGPHSADNDEQTVAIPRLDDNLLQILDAGRRRPAPRGKTLPAQDGKRGGDLQSDDRGADVQGG